MEVKTPVEPSAMTGSGSVHIHREAQAQFMELMFQVENSLRQFGDALPVGSVVQPCVGAPRGRFLLEKDSPGHPLP